MSSFGKRGPRRATLSGSLSLWLWAVAGVLIFLSVSPWNTLRTLFHGPTTACVIIDAGSSGSRVHVFRFLPRQGKTPLVRGPPRTLKLTPGLATFATSGNGLVEHLTHLLAFAQLHVPPVERAATPVVLLATAGVRLLEPETADRLMSACRAVLSGSGFRFSESWANVLSGSDEAAYAWVAANYLQGRLEVYYPLASVGVVELGGASAQVSFFSASIPPRANRRDVKLAGVMRLSLTTYSYLGLGLDIATAQALACASFAACTLEAERVLRTNESCEASRCLGGLPGPELRGGFVAIENLFHVAAALGLPLDASLAMLQRAAEERGCADDGALNGSQHVVPLKLGLEEHALSQERVTDPDRTCFNAAYAHTLLSALGFPADVRGVVQFRSGADWALGALVAQYAQLAPAPRWMSAARIQGLLGLGLCMGGATGAGLLWNGRVRRRVEWSKVAGAASRMHRSISF